MVNGLKKALLGFHSPSDLSGHADIFEVLDFKVTRTQKPEEMLALARETPYDWYLMDINLGHTQSDDVSPSAEVYEVVRDRVENGEAKFLAMSYAASTVEAATVRGIPAMDKCEFRPDLIDGE